jgi:hypothetical protein
MVARALLFAIVTAPALLFGQADFRVYIDHPRLFLDADRLRRLERDAQRETGRWMRLKELLEAGAPLEDKPATQALMWRLVHDEQAGRAAVDWAAQAAANAFAGPGELREGALVFDWTQDLLDETGKAAIVGGLAAGVQNATALAGGDVESVRAGAMAAIALAGHWEGSEPALATLLTQQWEREILPLLEAGELTDKGAELIAVLEICHVVRHNLERDLWQEAPEVFQALPMARILSYLPGAELSDEGRLRPRAIGGGSARELALGRIAEMLLVSYDIGVREFQFLQGFLRNDSYTLTGPLGAFYEFLWINPYVPGLSPTSGPIAAYDPVRGRVFARESWEDGARWLGWYGGKLVVRENGQEREVRPGKDPEVFPLPDFAIVLGGMEGKTELTIEKGAQPFGPRIWVVGPAPGMQYPVKIGKADFQMYAAGHGGVVELRNDPKAKRATIEYGEKIRLQLRAGSPAPKGPAPTLGPKL